jgi:hypothetical protein
MMCEQYLQQRLSQLEGVSESPIWRSWPKIDEQSVPGIREKRNELNVCAIRTFAGNGQTVCVTLGRRGAVALNSDGVIAILGRAVQPVDTTGAGDCFVGALAAQIAAGAPIRAALEYANIAASSLWIDRLGEIHEAVNFGAVGKKPDEIAFIVDPIDECALNAEGYCLLRTWGIEHLEGASVSEETVHVRSRVDKSTDDFTFVIAAESLRAHRKLAVYSHIEG